MQDRHAEYVLIDGAIGSFGNINQNILVSIVHLFDDIDKVSGHPDIIYKGVTRGLQGWPTAQDSG
jgi:hypothetical protein